MSAYNKLVFWEATVGVVAVDVLDSLDNFLGCLGALYLSRLLRRSLFAGGPRRLSENSSDRLDLQRGNFS